MAQVNRITRGEASVGALQIGTNDMVYGVDFGTVAIDPASIPATTRGATTFTLTGAQTTDIIIVNPPASLDDDLLFVGAAVTAADTVTIYLYNPTDGAIDQASATFSYCWIDTTA